MRLTETIQNSRLPLRWSSGGSSCRRGISGLDVKRLRIWVLGLIIACAFSLPVVIAQLTEGREPQLPPPFEVPSVDKGPRIVPPPPGFGPRVPDGFRVSVFAQDFQEPRWLAVAPNGDVFVADSRAGRVFVLRDPQRVGKARSRDVFAEDLDLPFGIAFHGDSVYVGDTNEVLRFRYDPKT